MLDIEKNPIIRTYSKFKQNFEIESYLKYVSNVRYRQALTKFRTSSHDLMIELGRHSPTPININERLCPFCNEIEDEIHFLINCPLYSTERHKLLKDIGVNINVLDISDPIVLFCNLMSLTNQHHQEKLGEFIHHSFKKRKSYTECN